MHLGKLFSFEGRIGRLEFWLTYLASLAAYGLGYAAAVLLFGQLAGGLLLLPLVVAYSWVSLAQSVKRLHDTSRSGWWLLKFTLAHLALVLIGVVGVVLGVSAASVGYGVLLAAAGVAMLVAQVYALWVMGIQGSHNGDNAYGSAHSGSVVDRSAALS
jgi:uncharacterized membrane protein YhaH (DUF805 family)